jgi:hypothetical protein
MDNIEHVAGIAAMSAEEALVARVRQHGVGRLARTRQRRAKLRIGASCEPVEAVDRLQPSVLLSRGSPHAVFGDAQREPAEERFERAGSAEVAGVEIAGGAEGVDPVAAGPGGVFPVEGI